MSTEYTELEILYSCSFWTNDGRSPQEAISQFVNVLDDCYESNKKSIACTENVNYGGQFYDIWGKDLEKSEQIFIFIHGGYWQEGEKKYATSMVKALTDHGIPVICLGYDLATIKPLDLVIEQVAIGLRFIAQKYSSANFTISGHSAGAHLAVKAICQLEDTTRFNKLALFSGVYQLEELPNTYIGKGINLTEEMSKKTSVTAEELKSKFFGQILILYGEFDSPKLKQQSEDLYGQIENLGNFKCQKMMIPNEDHFTSIENLRDSNSNVSKKLLKFLLEP
uniref:Arylformamidase n=1 Tax=Acrobeloides nanus TaxID=290746 RepID=A0A914BXK7_9BILA